MSRSSLMRPSSAGVSCRGGSLAARRIFDNPDIFEQQLQLLCFELLNPSPWRRLGIGKLEGPLPPLDFVLACSRLGQDLVELARRTTWAATTPLDDLQALLQAATTA